MSRLTEEPKQHIHDELCGDVNAMIIRIKLSYESLGRQMEYPSTEEIIDLLSRVRDEMNQCTKQMWVLNYNLKGEIMKDHGRDDQWAQM